MANMAEIKQRTGRINFFRVHEAGTMYGPPDDRLDAEVIIGLENDSSRVYGLPLKNNDKLPAARAMFSLLQDAFNANEPVTIDYREESGSSRHQLIRAWRVMRNQPDEMPDPSQ